MPLITLVLALSFMNGEGKNPPSSLQTNQSANATLLVAGSEKVTSMPKFSWFDATQCDAEGNLYFHSGFTLQDLVILKLLRDGSHVVYHPTDNESGGLSFVAFFADSEGKLSLLATNEKQELYLLTARSDPNSFTKIKLEVPDGAGPYTIRSFVTLTDIAAVLQGYFDDKAPKAKRGRAYLNQFDSSGKSIRLSTQESSKDAFKRATETLPGAASAVGSDGLIYFLEPDKILAVSQGGDIMRRIKLSTPEAGYDPWQLYVLGGRLLVSFTKGGVGHPIKTLYAVYDTSNGEQLKLYRADPALGNTLTCFSNDGLIFYNSDEQGNVKLVIAPLN